jgi:lipopolysaccharide biosynthesis glycosyltransferase
VALAPKCRFVHPRWNCQNSLFFWPEAREVFGDATVDEAIANPAILHFEGPELAKPWHYLCEHPLREQFWTHVRQTPWPDPPIQGRTLKNMARKHLPPGVLTPLRWMFRTARRVK